MFCIHTTFGLLIKNTFTFGLVRTERVVYKKVVREYVLWAH